MKPIKGWVVIDKDGYVIYQTFDPIKNEAIFQLAGRMDKSWKQLYGQGYRCIRVTLRAD